MPTTRPRRILRRAVMAVTGVGLMVVGYVGSDLSLQWLDGRGAIPEPLRAVAKAVCVPLDEYCETDLPGAKWLKWERIRWKHRGYRSAPDYGGFSSN